MKDDNIITKLRLRYKNGKIEAIIGTDNSNVMVLDNITNYDCKFTQESAPHLLTKIELTFYDDEIEFMG